MSRITHIIKDWEQSFQRAASEANRLRIKATMQKHAEKEAEKKFEEWYKDNEEHLKRSSVYTIAKNAHLIGFTRGLNFYRDEKENND